LARACLRKFRWRSIAHCFQAKWKRRPVDKWPVPKGHTSFSYELHLREAARWANYNWSEFSQLTADEMAATVAHYEIITRIETLENLDQIRKSKRKK
jgi:hypothetical protein